jgi:hypothetical protein
MAHEIENRSLEQAMNQLRLSFAALPILALLALPALGDTKMIMQEGTGVAGDSAEMPKEMRQAFANQEPTTATYWFTKDGAARIGGAVRMISRVDKLETYVVNDSTQSYTVLEIGGLDDPESAPSKASLVKTGGTRKIGSWDTVRYEMNADMGGEPIQVVLWVSEDIDIDFSAYRAFVQAMAAQPGFDWMLKFLEVDGFPVRQEFNLGPIMSWQELVSVSQETAPAGTFEPPAGYAKTN